MHKLLCTVATGLLLVACGTPGPQEPASRPATEAKPVTCPMEVPTGASCYVGEDGVGALYWLAIPKDWSPATGVLVMHAHGGPASTGPAELKRSEEDLKRWAVTVKAGYAWAGSTYRRGGYGVTMAAEDTERLRQIFVRQFGQPRRTLLHGQSYGGGVASKAAELYSATASSKSPYDGILLTSAVLGGGTRAYDFRLDLRVVYQYVCRNHPRADEMQYPLWMGLPASSKLTRTELGARVNECTGVDKPAAQRSELQKANLATIVEAVRIQERSLLSHLNWATWLFADLVQLRLGGRNPFGNLGVVYPGGEALNAGVLRYAADPVAVAQLDRDSAPEGRLTMPVLTLHAINDPTAFVELESLYRQIVDNAGSGAILVQTFSHESDHSYLANAQYPALFTALLDWIDKGDKPTPQKVLALCRGYEVGYGKGCHIQPEYQPPPIDSRVAKRQR
jgi:hypothetical protein